MIRELALCNSDGHVQEAESDNWQPLQENEMSHRFAETLWQWQVTLWSTLAFADLRTPFSSIWALLPRLLDTGGSQQIFKGRDVRLNMIYNKNWLPKPVATHISEAPNSKIPDDSLSVLKSLGMCHLKKMMKQLKSHYNPYKSGTVFESCVSFENWVYVSWSWDHILFLHCCG